MQLDLGVLYVGDRPVVLTLEPIGDDKVRVNMSSWTDAVVIRADEALEVLAIGKRLYVCSWSDAVVIRAEEALEVLAIGKRLFICRGERPASYPQPRHDRDDGRRLRAGYEVTRNVPL